jgi:arylsulfatase A-like enzyme
MLLETHMVLANLKRLGLVDDIATAYLGLKRGDAINSALTRWLARRPDRPFFVFLNYFDAHDPYDVEAPFDTLFGPVLPWRAGSAMGHRETDLANIRAQRDAYDRCLRYLDTLLGELVTDLERRGLLENTAIVFTSDHGEHFGEHGFMRHGNTLYLPVLRVPLVIRFSGRVPSGIRVPDPVTLRDLAATVLDLAGATAEDRLPGRSLSRYWAGRAESPAQDRALLYAEVRKGLRLPPGLPNSDGDLRSLIGNEYHFIQKTDGTEELYRYTDDPAQLQNLAQSPALAPVVMQMRDVLSRHLAGGSLMVAGPALR